MKFITFDENGELNGRYDTEVHGDAIPESAVEVSDELFDATISEIGGIWKIDAQGVIALVPFPPLTNEQLIQIANSERDALLRLAAIRIAPLQDAVDFGIASESEEASLLLWKKYRIDLNRLHLQEKYPKTINWPQQPDGE